MGYLDVHLQKPYFLKGLSARVTSNLLISLSFSSRLKISWQFLNLMAQFSRISMRPVQGVKYRLSKQVLRVRKGRRLVLLETIQYPSQPTTSLTTSSNCRLSRQTFVFTLSPSFQQSAGRQLLTFSLIMWQLMSELLPCSLMKQLIIRNFSPTFSYMVLKQQTKMVSSYVLATKRQDWAMRRAPSFIFTPYSLRIYSYSSYLRSVVNLSVFMPKQERYSTIQFCVKPQVSSVILMQLYFIFKWLSAVFSRRQLLSWKVVISGCSGAQYLNQMLIMVPFRFMQLSISNPKAEKGCLMNLASLSTVCTVRKVLQCYSCQNFMANCLLYPEQSRIPYTYRQTLHILAYRQSALMSMTSIVLVSYRQLHLTPPIRYSRSWENTASNPKPAEVSFRLLAVHYNVSRLKTQRSLYEMASPSVGDAYPPITIRQGDYRLTSIIVGSFLHSAGRMAPSVTVISSKLSLNCLKSVNRISQMRCLQFTFLCSGSKVQQVTKKPRPALQKMCVLIEPGTSKLVATLVHSMPWQSKMQK